MRLRHRLIGLLVLTASCWAISACGSVGEVSETAGPENILDLPIVATFNPAGAEFFTLENGVLAAVRGEQMQFIATRSTYDDFLLSVEFWVEPSTNSGIFVRCENADTFSPQSCYEVNIWDDHQVPEYRTGSIVSVSAPLVNIDSGNRWNSMSLRAEGEHITVSINNVVTAEIADNTHDSGYIALQYGGNNKMVRFRNLRITRL